MKDKTIFNSIGIILFFILTAIDKFIIELHPALYIIIGLTSITLIIVGSLHDKKKQPTKKKIKTIIIATLITLLLTIIYINPVLIYNNYKINNYLKEQIKKDKIDEIINIDYDKAYVFYPYTSKEDIEKELGIKSRFIKDNNINDNTKELIVIKDNKVIASLFIPTNINIQVMSQDNSISKNKETYFYIHKVDNDYNLLETPNYKEETYYNIEYKIPGIWYKEDNEDVSRMYYLGIDNLDYILVDIIDNFNYKKYKKNIEDISSEKEKIINKNKLSIIEIKKDNLYEVHYILSINEETYIFKLYTTNNTYNKNTKDLENVLKSIKSIKNRN